MYINLLCTNYLQVTSLLSGPFVADNSFLLLLNITLNFHYKTPIEKAWQGSEKEKVHSEEIKTVLAMEGSEGATTECLKAACEEPLERWKEKTAVHDALKQCWSNVGPPSATLAQRYTNIVLICRACWENDSPQEDLRSTLLFCFPPERIRQKPGIEKTVKSMEKRTWKKLSPPPASAQFGRPCHPGKKRRWISIEKI